MGCGKKAVLPQEKCVKITTKNNKKVSPKPDFLRVATVYATALIKPDAKGVFVSSDSDRYSAIFKTITPGLVSTNETEETSLKYDIVFITDDKLNVLKGANKVTKGGILANVFDASKFNAGEFKKFLESGPDLETCEYYLPTILDHMMKDGLEIKVLPTKALWKGVTYKEDIEELKEHIRKAIENGEYPENLWG